MYYNCVQRDYSNSKRSPELQKETNFIFWKIQKKFFQQMSLVSDFFSLQAMFHKNQFQVRRLANEVEFYKKWLRWGFDAHPFSEIIAHFPASTTRVQLSPRLRLSINGKSSVDFSPHRTWTSEWNSQKDNTNGLVIFSPTDHNNNINDYNKSLSLPLVR